MSLNYVKQDSITEQVAESLRAEIESGGFKAGARITEQQICELMQVSRTPVREAFRILQSEGYVTHKPRFGVVVSELSVKDIEEVWEVRVCLELQVARNTAKNITKSEKIFIEEQIERIDKALESEHISESEYNDIDTTYYEFHVSSCGNDTLVELVKQFKLSSTLIRRKPKLIQKRCRESLKEIKKIYEAYKENNADLACEYVKEHFELTLGEIKKTINK